MLHIIIVRRVIVDVGLAPTSEDLWAYHITPFPTSAHFSTPSRHVPFVTAIPYFVISYGDVFLGYRYELTTTGDTVQHLAALNVLL